MPFPLPGDARVTRMLDLANSFPKDSPERDLVLWATADALDNVALGPARARKSQSGIDLVVNSTEEAEEAKQRRKERQRLEKQRRARAKKESSAGSEKGTPNTQAVATEQEPATQHPSSTRRRSTMGSIGCIVGMALFALMLVASLFFIIEDSTTHYHPLPGGVQTVGTVTGIKQLGRSSFDITVTYATRQGVFTTVVNVSEVDYSLGQHVRVSYLPNAPYYAKTDIKQGARMFALFLPFVLAGALYFVLLLFGRRRGKKTATHLRRMRSDKAVGFTQPENLVSAITTAW